MGKKEQKLVLTILAILFLANVLAWLAVFDLAKSQFLEVIFFNVGQGDAIFIETSKRQQILIDGGPGSAVIEKLSREMSFWDRTIDLIILTHPEKDHLAGLIEVLKGYKVENILWTGVVRDTAEYREWKKLIEEERAKIFIAQTGQKIIVPTKPGNVVLDIFYPFENLEGQFFKNSNDTSIVSKLVFGENSFLFTGDACYKTEGELIDRGVNGDADVLKIGHHGSKTSTSDEFLKIVSPQIAVISAGKGNSYGHPHEEVLKVLAKYGIRILRTDLDGDIKIISDGENLKIKNTK